MELNREQIKKALDWLDSLVGNSNDSDIALLTYQLLGILYDTCEELTEENESLNGIIYQLGKNNDEIARVYPLAIKEAKANTVRKMQERLKAKAYTNNYCQDVVLAKNIDQIAKEMLEGDNDNT